MYTFYYLIDYTMSNKKSPNFNSSNPSEAPRSWWKGKVKNVALATAVAATLLSGSGCKNAADHTVSPKWDNTERVDSTENTVEQIDSAENVVEQIDSIESKESLRWTKRKKLDPYSNGIEYFYVEKDSVENYIITTIVNNELKVIKAPTNDIIGIGDFDGIFYYSCVIEWEDWQLKAVIMNENWDTIDYWLDYITGFILNKWNVGMTGFKDNEACYAYNGKIIDKWCGEYHIHYGQHNWIYVHSETLVSDDKQEHCELKTDIFIDGEKTPYSHTFEEQEGGGVSADLSIQDYGDAYYILYWGEKLENSTIIYKWKLIENVDANNIIAKLCYKKNDWKRYLLTQDGEEKELDLKEGWLMNY